MSKSLYTVTLELDNDDYDAIQRAVAIRQTIRVLPDYESCLMGVLIAEICRGWMEYRDATEPTDDHES